MLEAPSTTTHELRGGDATDGGLDGRGQCAIGMIETAMAKGGGSKVVRIEEHAEVEAEDLGHERTSPRALGVPHRDHVAWLD